MLTVIFDAIEHLFMEVNVFWLRRALGFAPENRFDEATIDNTIGHEFDDFPDDPTTDTVPKPLQNESDLE